MDEKQMKNMKFLPLGSIVRLKDGTKRIMICGRLQLRQEDQQIYDYCACYYPEGILDPLQLFVFNHEDVEEVCFLGYQDEEESQIQRYIIQKYQELHPSK